MPRTPAQVMEFGVFVPITDFRRPNSQQELCATQDTVDHHENIQKETR